MVAAVRVHKPGGPEAMVYEDVAVAAPGPGQIRIKQHACGINFIDVYFRTGMYPAPSSPFVIGNEGAGEVVAIGDGVKDFKVGDRVAYVAMGSYAAERLLPADRAVKLPDAISYEQAAGMMLKGMTAQYLVRRVHKVQRGDTILVHAAAGGVGLILCQWGKHLGATVIGTVGSQDKAALAKKNGADHTILYKQEDFAARTKDITGGKLCNVVYDGVGKDTFPKSLDCIRPTGMFASFGSASGPIEAFNIGILAQKGSLFATRPTLNTYTASREDLLATAKDLFDVVSSGAVKIPINQKYPLKDAQKAHRDLEGRATTGSSILFRRPSVAADARLTTHVLDTAAGRAAAGMRVVLWRLDGGETQVAEGRTNADGRFDRPLLEGTAFAFGAYRLDFYVGEYFRAGGVKLTDPAFLDVVPVRFGIAERAHYHVPLLVSPYGYSTYRGS